jgi:hypothetical protein
MLKMKCYIGDVLLCLKDKSLKSLTNTFLHELNSKDANIILGLIPDAISRLLDQPHDQFCILMQKMFGFVNRERHFLPLVDKLCDRFQITTNMHEW